MTHNQVVAESLETRAAQFATSLAHLYPVQEQPPFADLLQAIDAADLAAKAAKPCAG